MKSVFWWVVFLVPLAATIWTSLWLAKSWRELRSPVVLGRSFVVAAGGVAMFSLVGVGFMQLIERGADKCLAAAKTIDEINRCDPGLGAMLGATAAGMPWLLLTLLGAVFFLAAVVRFGFTGHDDAG